MNFILLEITRMQIQIMKNKFSVLIKKNLNHCMIVFYGNNKLFTQQKKILDKILYKINLHHRKII